MKVVQHMGARSSKKDLGVGLTDLTNKEKTILIDALRQTYPLSDLLDCIDVAKSSYFYQKGALRTPDKYANLRIEVCRLFYENDRRYGYRRIHELVKRDGTVVSEKIVQRIMKEEQLIVAGKRKRKYSSYLGEIGPEIENILERDFHATKPNLKWLTDLTEFHIPAGKVYLSPILDCFDGMAVSWNIGTRPNADLVNTMLDDAIATLNDDEKPIVHHDRGCHYRWPGWIERMDRAKLMRSMSAKGCSADNAACESFFGHLKNEMFYTRSWYGVSIKEFIEILDDYMHWYNEKRIKMTLGAQSPVEYRKSLEYAA